MKIKQFFKLLFGVALGVSAISTVGLVNSQPVVEADAATTYTIHYDVLETESWSMYNTTGDFGTVFLSTMQKTSDYGGYSNYFPSITDDPVSITTKSDIYGHAYYLRVRAYLTLPAMTYVNWRATFAASFIRTGSTSSTAYTVAEVFILSKNDSGVYENPAKFNSQNDSTKSTGAASRTVTSGSTKVTDAFQTGDVVMANRTNALANINFELGVFLYASYDASNATGGTFTLTNNSNIQTVNEGYELQVGSNYFAREEMFDAAAAYNATSGQTFKFLKSFSAYSLNDPLEFTQDGNIVFEDGITYNGYLWITGANVIISGNAEVTNKTTAVPLFVRSNATVTVSGSMKFTNTCTSNAVISAVRVLSSTATFTNCTFETTVGSTNSSPKTVDVDASTVTLNNCTVISNYLCINTANSSTIAVNGGSIQNAGTSSYAYGINLGSATEKLYIYGNVQYTGTAASRIYCSKETVYFYNQAKTINYTGDNLTIYCRDTITINSSTPQVLLAYANSSSVASKVSLNKIGSGDCIQYSSSNGGLIVTTIDYKVTVTVNNGTYSFQTNAYVNKIYTCRFTVTPNSGYKNVTTDNVTVTNASFSVSSNVVSVYSATGDVTVTVNLSPIAYAVNFDANNANATGTMEALTPEYGSKITIPECSFALANYNFVEWNTSADGSGDSYAPGDEYTVPAKETTFYAIWEINDIAVVRNFVDTYMHMSESVPGQCIEYYPPAKTAYNALSATQKGLFASEAEFAEAYVRLSYWAYYHGDEFDSNGNIVEKQVSGFINTIQENKETVIAPVACIVILGCSLILIRKRKEQ